MLCACLVAIACGCAAAPRQGEAEPAEPPVPAPDVLDYLAARGFDLLDIASARLAVGPGLLAHARATRWLAIGAGSIGKAEWWASGFELPNYGVGWLLRQGGAWIERRAEIGISTFYYCESESQVLGGNRTTFPPECRGDFDFGGEVHFALVGLAVEARPDEFLDFLAGLAGFDPRGDDG